MSMALSTGSARAAQLTGARSLAQPACSHVQASPRPGRQQPVVARATTLRQLPESASATKTTPESMALYDPETVKVQDYATLQRMLSDVQQNIAWRQDKINLMTEEVHQLRSQMGFLEDKPGAFPAPAFLLSPGKALSSSTTSYAVAMAAIVAVGGILVPMAEAKVGLGGAAYYDLISSLGLPTQLAEVDPMIASHCGGIVGVLTAALSEEASNAKLQVQYASGTPYFPLTDKSMRASVALYGLSVLAIVVFGGIAAPVVVEKLMGASNYYDVITSLGLPIQLAEVDPIVASHCGGLAGIITAQRISESNKNKQKKRR